ncbi:MAG: YpdA family putative bacillithiol disulfide reductase [Gemmatimonadaceae bacterium]
MTAPELTTDVVVIGAGPCGLAVAISLEKAGFRTLILDAESVVSSILQYPTYATFFSTAEKLSLGGLPFIIAESKPGRREALAYYRGVVKHFGLNVRQYERALSIEGTAPELRVRSIRRSGEERVTTARAVVVATGYWGSPNFLRVPGEQLPHVTHAYHEGHVAFQQPAVVVGGGNSAAEAALDLWRAGADVTLIHFGPEFDKKIKPWILPDLNNRIAEGAVEARWNSRVTSIDAEHVSIVSTEGVESKVRADHVFLLTGYAPNVDLLRNAGVPIDAVTGIPKHDPGTLETAVPGVFIAGVVVAGFDANKVFIENGRFHGDFIAAKLLGSSPPPAPKLSRELDT